MKGITAYVYLGMVALAAALSVRIAVQTTYNVHPDESGHVDAFCYFGQHWWPPDLNDHALLYSPDGWSRVYNGELAYLVLGRLGRWLPVGEMLPKAEPPPVPESAESMLPAWRVFLPYVASMLSPCMAATPTYRLLNSLLYVVTLLVIWRSSRHGVWIGALGVLLMALPQVLYVYSYANSDAWGLTFGILLALFAVARAGRAHFTLRDAAGLGFLTGMVLLSKSPFWLLIAWAYLVVGFAAWQRRRAHTSPPLSASVAQVLIAAGIAFLIVAPLKVIYPLTQENYTAQAAAMREQRSREDFKLSRPTSPGYLLARKGVPFGELVENKFWWTLSGESFYGSLGICTSNRRVGSTSAPVYCCSWAAWQRSGLRWLRGCGCPV
jgi:hypothetical protein